MPLQRAIDGYLATLQLLHVRDVARYEELGVVTGLGSTGRFDRYRDGDRSRSDLSIGIQTQRELQLGNRVFAQNTNGDVRELTGIALRRRVTSQAIDSGAFARNPEYDRMLGLGRVADGRLVWIIRVAPPGGEPYHVGLDARTYLIDEIAYRDADAIRTIDYSDERSIDGLLVPYMRVESDGNGEFAITERVHSVVVNPQIPKQTFAPFVSTTIQTAAPVRVPLRVYDGLLFVAVRVQGIDATFLLDSGSQGIVLDPAFAHRLGLVPQGRLEVSGAHRTRADGVVALAALHIGAARIPVGVASVVDLSQVINASVKVDGILGYPLFAQAEVRIDPDTRMLTLAMPGSLRVRGNRVEIDTDRELAEVDAQIDGVPGRCYVDTADSSELLLFEPFLKAHPGLVNVVGQPQALERGIGGWNYAAQVMIDRLSFDGFTLFHRRASALFASHGAFADRYDAGNIGYGTLQNFVMTFDLVHRALYLQPAKGYDDGRYRPFPQEPPPGIP